MPLGIAVRPGTREARTVRNWLGGKHGRVSVLVERVDQGVPAGPGADLGHHHEVSLVLAGNPGGLTAGPGGRGVLGIEDHEPQEAGSGPVSLVSRHSERELAGGGHWWAAASRSAA